MSDSRKQLLPSTGQHSSLASLHYWPTLLYKRGKSFLTPTKQLLRSKEDFQKLRSFLELLKEFCPYSMQSLKMLRAWPQSHWIPVLHRRHHSQCVNHHHCTTLQSHQENHENSFEGQNALDSTENPLPSVFPVNFLLPTKLANDWHLLNWH